MDRYRWAALVVLLAAAVGLAAFGPLGDWLGFGKGGDASEARPEKGYLAPDFALPGLDGETIRLSDYRGKVVFLNFWATWCPPCLVEMPEMQKLYEQEGDDLEIIGIDLTHTEDAVEDVAAFMDEHGYAWPIALDQKGDVTLAYRTLDIPTSFFIDQNGIIREIHQGPMTLETMTRLVERTRRAGR